MSHSDHSIHVGTLVGSPYDALFGRPDLDGLLTEDWTVRKSDEMWARSGSRPSWHPLATISPS